MISLLSYPEFDFELFKFINQYISNDFFDSVMPFLRHKWFWLPLYVFVFSFMFYKWGKRGWLVLFFFLLSFGAADYVSASLIKPLMHRERPCNDIKMVESVNIRVDCGVAYSFPSAHASNHAAMGVFLFLLFGKIANKGRYVFLIWAFLVSFAQVYVGVHYPLDIFAGWILGIILGTGLFLLLKFYFRFYYQKQLIET